MEATAKLRFSLVVKEDDWRLLQAVIKKADSKWGECSWLGIGSMKGGVMEVRKIIYPEQVNSRGETDMPSLALSQVLLEHVTENDRIVWWGHSHGSMGVFYSGTDETCWKQWTDGNTQPFLGTCHNAKGEIYTRVSIGGVTLELDRLPLLFERNPVADAAVEAAMSKMRGTTASHFGYDRDRDGNWEGIGFQNGRSSTKSKDAGLPYGTYISNAALRILEMAKEAGGMEEVKVHAGYGENSEHERVWDLNFSKVPSATLHFAKAVWFFKGDAHGAYHYSNQLRGLSTLLAVLYLMHWDEVHAGHIEGCTLEDLSAATPGPAFFGAAESLILHGLNSWAALTKQEKVSMLGLRDGKDNPDDLMKCFKDDGDLLKGLYEDMVYAVGEENVKMPPCFKYGRIAESAPASQWRRVSIGFTKWDEANARMRELMRLNPGVTMRCGGQSYDYYIEADASTVKMTADEKGEGDDAYIGDWFPVGRPVKTQKEATETLAKMLLKDYPNSATRVDFCKEPPGWQPMLRVHVLDYEAASGVAHT